MHILLDPYILAVPQQPERTEEYIETLFTWIIAITNSRHHFWLSQSIVGALWDVDCYPFWNILQQLEQRMPPDKAYNVNTILRACEPQLMNPPLLDDLLNNSTWYYEDEQVLVIPSEIEARLPEQVSHALKKTLAMSALGKQMDIHEAFDNLLFGTISDGFQGKMLNVNFKIQHMDTEQTQDILHSLDMLFSPDEMDELEDITSLWQDTERVITHVYKRIFASSTTLPTLPVVFSHTLFNKNVASYKMESRPALLSKLFRAIVLGLTGEIPRNHKMHHPLHFRDKPLRRGSITAWRLWIEHSNPGWRVHYWLYPNGCIELANFVKHDDFSIPEPSRKS